jgi:hemicentin
MISKFSFVVPPKLDESSASKLNISVVVNNPVVIDCSADGIPPPEIVWYKDGREIIPDQIRDIRILPSGRRLEISSADLTDAGKYKCVARNAAGKVERDFELYVWSKYFETHLLINCLAVFIYK